MIVFDFVVLDEAVEPLHREAVDRGQLGGWIRRGRVAQVAEVELLRACQLLVRGLGLVDVEEEIVPALDQERRRRDRAEVREDRARRRQRAHRREVLALDE